MKNLFLLPALLLPLVFASCNKKDFIQIEYQKDNHPQIAYTPSYLLKKKSLKSGSEKVHLTLWMHYNTGNDSAEGVIMNQIIDEFNSVQDDIVIHSIDIKEMNYKEYVSRAASIGELPDILDFDGPFIYNYIEDGVLIPLDSYISPSLEQDLLPSILTQGRYHGKLYSLGQFDSGLALWARKSLLLKAGIRIPHGIDDNWSSKEFNEILSKLQNLKEVKHALDLRLDYDHGEWYTYGFLPMIQSFGGNLINRKKYDKASEYLNSTASVKAMKQLQSWINKGWVSREKDAFLKGDTALSYVGHWTENDYRNKWGDDLILIPIPTFGNRPVTGMGSWTWAITRNCNYPLAAWKFISFLMEKKQIKKICTINSAIPSRLSVLNTMPSFQDGGRLHIYVSQLQRIAQPRPFTASYPKISEYFTDAVINIINGKDVKTELNKAARLCDLYLQGDNDE